MTQSDLETSFLAGKFGNADCDSSDVEPYDLSNHWSALGLVLLCSAIGALLPLIVARFPWIHPPQILITFGNFFGTGVVIATAFVHLVPAAVWNLNNHCLTDHFASIASLLVMFAVFAMHLVEFVVAKKIGSLPSPEETQSKSQKVSGSISGIDCNAVETGAVTNQNSAASLPPMSNGSTSHIDQHNAELAAQTSVFYLFEMGVAIHSILMGLSLGVLTSTPFLMLLISLCFHQFFEGFALGSAVTTVETTYGSALKVIAAFSLASPMGMIVGIGLRQIFIEDYTSTLYLLGTTEAFGSGILIYTGLIELLTYGLTLNPHFSSKSASKTGTAAAFIGLYSGCTIISLYTWYDE